MAKKLATLKPPLFMGKEDPMLVENWVRDFDKIFTVAGTPEAQKVDQATFYLRENADTWWENEGSVFRAQENFKWEVFKQPSRIDFSPKHIRRQKYSEFSRFNQTVGMSVQEYAEKFNKYARFCPNVVPNERAKAQKFEDGLTFRIQKKVIGAGTAATYKEAYDRACNIERILRREQEVKDRHKRKGNGKSSSNHQGYDKKPRLRGNSHGNSGNGYNCQGDPITCYECREPGHKERDCLRKQNINRQGQGQAGQGNNNGNNGGGFGRNFNYNNRFNNNNAPHQGANSQGGNNGKNNNVNAGGNNNGRNNGNGRISNGRIFVMNQN
ncbi:myb-like protein Z [Chenopodium quinoa]|uniref:myb-like protein Z n=1 Tax=Chenopodium quinoa TaxID=63459 RepID=UPI000B772047|nr:myb-like protein Z [Chenopodium quinoa]